MTDHFEKNIGVKAKRKIRAKNHAKSGVWFGLGMMGLVGWSVVIPTLLGAGLGVWLDTHYPDGRSWTLALLVGGLTLGCFNAWHWISKEDQAIRDEQNDDDSIT
ncbi:MULTISPECIES: AtpZ/AtpI family protein [Thalassolituus]|jgi:ATP synthase protein I|uniref:AtpZ/AtpI family protein n=1 Tax=Thalassolituus TaxID=187492 RepID=UPI000BD45EBF|nr:MULTISPECIES: AtpZ/AtpI family protein [Thalassolituus]PCI48510.1 MAG: F0F1 ATP synthase subunit [Oceanospirillales bacterium]PHQ85170.1 MAG: F0F1 ATP synthase subunit [Thalassobium sp.]MBQ0728227.1 AtpZ/AtpI family protein [Thalassolituus oleivorans]MBQ0779452.1 AtpZ/AtpI family protein [Thalassolituus oleivorans]MCA6127791.1 ATP synthase [Thalassolituus oleivorans 4BN06-13]